MHEDSRQVQELTHDEAVRKRTLAFIAAALGLVGALGGGVVAQTVPRSFYDPSSAIDADLMNFVKAAVPGALGFLAVGAAAQVDSTDAVAAPVARAALVLGAIALLGAALIFIGAFSS